MKASVILIALLLSLVHSVKDSITIFRQYHIQNSDVDSENTKVGEILLSKEDKKFLTAELSLVFESILESSALQNQNDYAVLTFRQGDLQFKYTISYNDVIQNNYKQTINVIANQNGNVLGLNYFQEKLKKKEYRSSNVNVIKPEQGKQHIFTYTTAPTKPKGAEAEQEEQTFFSKYKWYLIGFGVVVYIISNMDPEKMNQMAQQQAQARG